MSENTQSNAQEASKNAPSPETDKSGQESSDAVILKLQEQVKEAEQKYIYLYAEFENFKKRSIKERQDTLKFACEPVASELLPVLDNLERALQYAKPDTDANLLTGLQMVATQFRSALEKQGVQTIQSIDRPFTPELHEAMGEVPSVKPQGTIIQEHMKGYTLHGRLLRPSRVMVSSGVANSNGSGPGQN